MGSYGDFSALRLILLTPLGNACLPLSAALIYAGSSIYAGNLNMASTIPIFQAVHFHQASFLLETRRNGNGSCQARMASPGLAGD